MVVWSMYLNLIGAIWSQVHNHEMYKLSFVLYSYYTTNVYNLYFVFSQSHFSHWAKQVAFKFQICIKNVLSAKIKLENAVPSLVS